MPLETYKRFSTKEPSRFTSTTDKERRFYQGSKWRGFRSRMMSQQLILDARLARKKLEAGELDLKLYATWLQSSKPLCVHCMRSNIPTPANVLDHVKAIRDGGGVFDSSNLQWLCDSCHNRKSNADRRGRED